MPSKSQTARTFPITRLIIFLERATGSGASPCARQKMSRSSASASPTAKTSIPTANRARWSSSSNPSGGSTRYLSSWCKAARSSTRTSTARICGSAASAILRIAGTSSAMREIRLIRSQRWAGFVLPANPADRGDHPKRIKRLRHQSVHQGLDTVLAAFQRSVTRDTTRLYECMGDAYQCHLRVHLAVTKLFHLGLPLVVNEYLWDPWE